MGGKAFANLSNLRRIRLEEIEPTINRTIQLLDFPDLTVEYFMSALLGSTGKKPDSGDIDVVMNITKNSSAFDTSNRPVFDKDSFLKRLREVLPKEQINSEWAKMGVVLTAWPIAGDESSFIQIDFMFGDFDFFKFSHYSPSSTESKFPGVFVSQAMGVLAKHTHLALLRSETVLDNNDEYRLAEATYVYNLEGGIHIRCRLYDPKTRSMKVVDVDDFETRTNFPRIPRIGMVTDPKEIVRLLFGRNIKVEDVNTFEKIVNVLRNKMSEEEFNTFKLRFCKSIKHSGAKHYAKELGYLEFENNPIWKVTNESL